jgi:ABC-type transport system involved in multi-copper enzyme maturation permease subunit
MTFLPIVARELRVAARRPGTYWVRSGTALTILVIGTWFFLMYSGLPKQEVAMGLFCLLTGSAVLYCLLSGVWFTADCLSEEKREGTLGLLFLTDLKGYDVVLGKLVATSLNGFYAVLAVVPILALPLLLGGVAPGEFGRMALVVLNTLFFSLTLGICVSAMSCSPRKAMAITFMAILLLAAVLPACGAWRSVMAGTKHMGRGWLLASAGFSYYQALDASYKTGPAEFWWSVAVIHGLSWMFLLVASLIVPRAWQERPAGAQTLRWRERWQGWSYGDVAERAEFRKRLLDRGAYFWLAARARLGPAYVWAVLGLLACGWTWGLARSRRDWLDQGTYILTGLLLNLIMKIWFALEAGRPLAEDRRQGALELLLSTPLTVQDILRGQLLALKRQFLGPVMVTLLVFFLFMLVAASDDMLLENAGDRSFWVLFWSAGMVMLVADLAALYWVGMWKALTARNPTRAAAGNLARILVLPWVVLALGVLVAALIRPDTENEVLQKLFLGAWVVVGLAADLAFGSGARRNLRTEFRLVATRRYEPLSGFWKRLLGVGAQASTAPPPTARMADVD